MLRGFKLSGTIVTRFGCSNVVNVTISDSDSRGESVLATIQTLYALLGNSLGSPSVVVPIRSVSYTHMTLPTNREV